MSAPDAAETPIHVESQSHFEELVADADVALVDFYADWCGPCQMLEPTVESVADGSDAVVVKVDIDELRDLAEEFGVRSVPTLQFFADGEPAERLVGVQDEDDILAVIDELQ